MTPDVLHGLLWLARAGLRARGEAVHAGHGYADPNYRPPRLPYLSLTGPLDLRIEAERDPGRKRFVFVQNPGYLAGAERDGTHLVPAPGRVYLRFDGDARATLDVDFGALAGTPFGTDPTGDAVAAGKKSRKKDERSESLETGWTRPSGSRSCRRNSSRTGSTATR